MPHIAQDQPQQPGSSTMQLEAQPTAPLRMTAGHFLADAQLGLGGNQAASAAPSTATALQAAQPFRHSPQFLPSSRLPAEALPPGPTMSLLQSLRQHQQQLQGQPFSSGLQPSQPAQQQPSLEQMACPSISSDLHHAQQPDHLLGSGLQTPGVMLGNDQLALQHAYLQPQQLSYAMHPMQPTWPAYSAAPWPGTFQRY